MRGYAATTVTGRVMIQLHGQDEWVTLHGVDAKGYILTGTLLDDLRKIARNEPAFNLVTISGELSAKSNVSCERRRIAESADKKQQDIREEAICIRYHYFEPTRILSVATTTEPLPPLLRDAGREQNMLSQREKPVITPAIIGEIYGIITQCNFRSPIKTIEVKNRDTQSPVTSLTAIVTANTKVVKNTGVGQPVELTPDGLKTGQRVTVVYSTNETRTEALYITITKD